MPGRSVEDEALEGSCINFSATEVTKKSIDNAADKK
jgi:hypothetical protein